MDLLEQSASLMRALAHPHRLRICGLVMQDRVPVHEIARQLKVAPNAVSQHLNMMKAHGRAEP